jgi:hypothetical protein
LRDFFGGAPAGKALLVRRQICVKFGYVSLAFGDINMDVPSTAVDGIATDDPRLK